MNQVLWAQPFEKDGAFGEDGEMILTHGTMLVTADDKIVLYSLIDGQVQVVRMTKDGIHDMEFGTDGMTALNFEEEVFIIKLLERKDGKIILFGRLIDSLNQQQILAIGLEKNGQIDMEFGKEGVIKSAFEAFDMRIDNMALQEDGKLIVVGEKIYPIELGAARTSDCLMIRFNPDGTLDSTFGIQGIVLMDFSEREGYFSEVAILNNEKIIAAGDFENNLRERDYGIARFTSNGVLDTSFGEAGKVTLNFNLANDYLRYMNILENDKILVGGSAFNRVKEDVVLAQFTSDGQLDTTFGEGGIVLSDLSGFSSPALQSSDRPTTFLRKLDGSILLFGNMHTSKVLDDYQGFFVQYTANGWLDDSFGNGGQLITGNYYELFYYSLANQSDGKIMATGVRQPDSDRIVFITRFLPDLSVGAINFSQNLNSIAVYPNPIQQQATLRYALETPQVITIQLTDLNGRILKTYLQNQHQQAGEHQQIIDLPNDLSKGFYIVRIASANGQFTIKVVK